MVSEQNVQLLAQQDVNSTEAGWHILLKIKWHPSWDAINQQLDYGFGDRYRQPDHFNAVVDLAYLAKIIKFLNNIEYECLQSLFNRIDAEYWQKLLDWFPQNEHVQFF